MTKFSNSKTDEEKNKYNLEERLAKFAEDIIDFVKTVEVTVYNKRIIDQLIGCGGSSGANYCEATEAESKKDFIHKICIAKKEVKEAKHWLRLIARTNPERKEEIRILWQEAHELTLILSKIVRTSRSKK